MDVWSLRLGFEMLGNAGIETAWLGDADVDGGTRRNETRISDAKEALHRVGDACTGYNVTCGSRDAG